MQTRRWLSLYGINFLGFISVVAVVAWWVGNLSLTWKGAAVAGPAALAFTFRETWGWTQGPVDDRVWRKRFLQTVVLWAVVFVGLGLVLASTGKS